MSRPATRADVAPWLVTEHAALRYQERFAPQLSALEARDEVWRLAQDARETGRSGMGRELWSAFAAPHLVLVVGRDDRGTRVVVTVLDAGVRVSRVVKRVGRRA